MTFEVPLTPMQQRVWFMEASQPGRPEFNICSAHRLAGRIEPARLQRAFDAVVQEQAALRLAFAVNDQGEVRQGLSEQRPGLQLVDAQGWSAAQLDAAMAQDRQAPFELMSAGPLCRARLYLLSADEAVFVFVGHHLICDGWSMMVLTESMARHVAGDGEVKVDDGAYLRFAQAQRHWLDGGAAEEDMAHCLDRLTPLPDPLAFWPMPAAPDAQREPVGRMRVDVPDRLLQAVRQKARDWDASMFTVLLSAYALVLGRTAGQHDLAVGVPVKGRVAPEHQHVIGFFANTLPVRIAWDASTTFEGLVAHVGDRLKEAMQHANLPFERLIQRLPIRRDAQSHPVYQAQFSYVDLRRRGDRWGAWARSSVPVPTFGGAEAVSLLLLERQDGSTFEWCHRTEAVSADVAQGLMKRFQALLEAIVQPGVGAQPVGLLSWLDPEAHASVQRWAQGPVRVWPWQTVWGAMVAMRDHDARAPALWDGATWLDRDALMQQVGRLAQVLRAHGVKPGDRIGLSLRQGPRVTQAILAIWSCRAAYVPLDPSHPTERLDMIRTDAACRWMLMERDDPSVEALAQAWRSEGVDILFVDAVLDGSAPVEGLDEADGGREAAEAGQARDVAYLMYTSGSTGKPKGVVVSQGAVVNMLCGLRETLAVQPADRWLAVTTPGFDISVLESFLPLLAGGALAWASREDALDGETLAALLVRHRITAMQGTPSTWTLLCEAQGGRTWGLHGSGERRLALVGGEPLAPALAQRMLALGAEVWNMYGPTETTVWSTCARIEGADEASGAPLSIGRPIANTLAWIADASGQVCPPGVRGQICLAGAGVADGYWAQEGMTADRFVMMTAPNGRRVRTYLTGDVGTWDAQGRLHCLGRQDRQIKWRGHRIEPGEVEAAIVRAKGCREAVVHLVTGDAGPVLVAYLDGAPGGSVRELRAQLTSLLPAYMVPGRFLMLDAGLPRLPNGKVDHRALDAALAQEPPLQLEAAAPQVALSEVGRQLLAVWQQVLGVQDIRPEDNFFDLGGHSLLALQAAHLMAQQMGVHFSPRKFVFEDFSQLAGSYERALAGTDPKGAEAGAGGASASGADTQPAASRDGTGLLGKIGRSVRAVLGQK
ncbi:MAG: amino acid adenylation domain-containing protein [Aquabacterium sp.]